MPAKPEDDQAGFPTTSELKQADQTSNVGGNQTVGDRPRGALVGKVAALGLALLVLVLVILYFVTR